LLAKGLYFIGFLSIECASILPQVGRFGKAFGQKNLTRTHVRDIISKNGTDVRRKERTMALSARQKAMLDFIRQYIRENQFPPTIREIGEHVGISSTSVVNYNLNALVKKRFLERDENVARGLRLVEQEEGVPDWNGRDLVRVPLLGYIAAGDPLPIPESSADFSLFGSETVQVPGGMLRNNEEVYALKVRGDSMIDALVNDGDIVVLKHQLQAQNGDMVAAWLREEHETTLKRFYHEGSRVRLQPANPTMDPMYFPAENVEVRGKVVMVIRQLA
jgi:repressor LexA